MVTSADSRLKCTVGCKTGSQTAELSKICFIFRSEQSGADLKNTVRSLFLSVASLLTHVTYLHKVQLTDGWSQGQAVQQIKANQIPMLPILKHFSKLRIYSRRLPPPPQARFRWHEMIPQLSASDWGILHNDLNDIL